MSEEIYEYHLSESWDVDAKDAVWPDKNMIIDKGFDNFGDVYFDTRVPVKATKWRRFLKWLFPRQYDFYFPSYVAVGYAAEDSIGNTVKVNL